MSRTVLPVILLLPPNHTVDDSAIWRAALERGMGTRRCQRPEDYSAEVFTIAPEDVFYYGNSSLSENPRFHPMSEQPTPRTDAARIDNADLHDQGYGKSEMVRADFARELERELGHYDKLSLGGLAQHLEQAEEIARLRRRWRSRTRI